MPSRLHTLGTLGIDGAPKGHVKALVLLAYLCLEGRQPRRRLAELFWPDASDPRNQLSVTLSRLARDLPGSFEMDGVCLAATVRCDAVETREALERGWVEEALALHRGRFLSDVSVRGVSDELHEWVEDTADGLARSLQAGLIAEAGRRWQRDPARAVGLVRHALEVADASLLTPDDLRTAHSLLADAHDPRALALAAEARELWPREPRSDPRSGPDVGTRDAAVSWGPSRPHQGEHALLGRSADLERLLSALSTQNRLITITGPGGIGKSTLAAAALRHPAVRARFAGGTFRVGCDGLSSAAEVCRVLHDVLDLPVPSGGACLGAVAQELARRGPTLLLLDDFDDLAADADWLGPLIDAATGATLVVTSSLALEVTAEAVLPLSGLSSGGEGAGDAGALFMEHALRADATFEPEAGDDARLRQLATLLGGNPLALALAAQWVGVMPVSAILAEVENGLELLSNPAKDAPERHRSLQAVLERRWRLLDPDEQAAVTRIAVFLGPFDREDAHAVAGVGVSELAGLVRRSVLTRPDRSTFECHPTLRRWVLGRADASAVAESRDRHGRRMLEVAQAAARELDGSGGGAWLSRLDRLRADLVGAIDRSLTEGRYEHGLRLLVALAQYWIRRGHIDLASPRYEVAARTAVPRSLSPLKAACLRSFAFMLMASGRLERPAVLLASALESARAGGDVGEEVRCLNALGVLEAFRFDLDRALSWYSQALPLAEEHGLREEAARVLNNLGDVHLFEGRPERALELYERAVAEERAVGNLQMTSNVLGSIGLAHAYAGRLEEAGAALTESLRLVGDLGITFSVPAALEQHAALQVAAGRPLVAGRLWGAAETVRASLGIPLERFAAAERERWWRQAEEQSEPNALTVAMSSGRGMRMAEAVEMALHEASRLASASRHPVPKLRELSESFDARQFERRRVDPARQ